MSKQIEMDEIPFAPIAPLAAPVLRTAPVLCDTIPPTEPPPAPLPTKRPVRHVLVAWRNDGGLDHTSFETLESAVEAAKALHFVTYWKWAITCGRETVETARIDEPADFAECVRRFEEWHRKRTA